MPADKVVSFDVADHPDPRIAEKIAELHGVVTRRTRRSPSSCPT